MAVKQLALLVHPDKTQHPRAVEHRGASADAQSVGRRTWRLLNDFYMTLIYPLVIEHGHGIDGPFIVSFPIKNGDFPWLC